MENTHQGKQFHLISPVDDRAFFICLMENPISRRGAAMGGGGGEGDRVLIGAGTEIKYNEGLFHQTCNYLYFEI